MKLDKNTTSNKEGKYALINMREVRALPEGEQKRARDLIDELQRMGVIKPMPFFVLGYNDMFAESGLRAYADAVQAEAEASRSIGDDATADSLLEYAEDMYCEANIAERGNKIPD